MYDKSIQLMIKFTTKLLFNFFDSFFTHLQFYFSILFYIFIFYLYFIMFQI